MAENALLFFDGFISCSEFECYTYINDTMQNTKHDFGYATAAPDRYQILKEYAKQLRKNMTEAETILWEELKQLDGYHFRRQHPINDYIADFICLSAHLIIEVDGKYHDIPQQQIEDDMRTDALSKMGYTVVRFTNEEIITDVDRVVDEIYDILDEQDE